VRVGEVAAAAGVGPSTIRFYERRRLLPPPPRTAGGYRDYGPEAVERVAFVKAAQQAGLTLRQIAEVLRTRDEGKAPCRHVARLVEERLEDVERSLVELQRVRGQLLEVRARATALDEAACRPAEICSAVLPAHEGRQVIAGS
jgi:MerR family copper efflux transcriptional regulator